jgi:hypothetical protein
MSDETAGLVMAAYSINQPQHLLVKQAASNRLVAFKGAKQKKTAEPYGSAAALV